MACEAALRLLKYSQWTCSAEVHVGRVGGLLVARLQTLLVSMMGKAEACWLGMAELSK